MPDPTSHAHPAIGRIVHYVAYGTPGGEYQTECRAAIVTQVTNQFDIGAAVLNPLGMFFHPSLGFHPGNPADDAGGARCASGERAYPGGTWHWPEIV